MTKAVCETSAGKSISALVVLNPKGEHVATIQFYFANSGGVTCTVLTHGDAACKRTAEAMGYGFGPDDKIVSTPKGKGHFIGKYAYKVASDMTGHAGGYGYDKRTAALSGLVVDGHKMTDHCGGGLERPKGRLWNDKDKARLAKKGYTLSNWSGPVEEGREPGYGRKGVPNSASGWASCYRLSGYEYLQAIGYRVIRAI